MIVMFVVNVLKATVTGKDDAKNIVPAFLHQILLLLLILLRKTCLEITSAENTLVPSKYWHQNNKQIQYQPITLAVMIYSHKF